ncbi:hypothetical protein CSC75_19215 [Pseudoxanthomonas wuyuanensis]|nr:hypothetical protein CSC75_19215 [Pseudoxanthomonas wuyuanensis]
MQGMVRVAEVAQVLGHRRRRGLGLGWRGFLFSHRCRAHCFACIRGGPGCCRPWVFGEVVRADTLKRALRFWAPQQVRRRCGRVDGGKRLAKKLLALLLVFGAPLRKLGLRAAACSARAAGSPAGSGPRA